MEPTVGVSVIIPWADREELEIFLRENARFLNRDQVEVLLVNAGGDGTQLRRYATGAAYRALRIVDVPVETFNKNLALNLGAHFSRGRRLLFLDADIVLASDFLSEAIPMLDGGGFVTVRHRYESVAAHPSPISAVLAKDPGCFASVRRVQYIEARFSDGSTLAVRFSANDLLAGSDAGHAHVLLNKSDFLEVGGYHSAISTWGWDDDDLLFRLQKALGLLHREAGEVRHLSHGDDKRMLEGGSKFSRNAANMALCFERYAKQNFLGTYLEDGAEWAARCGEFDMGVG